MYVLFECDLCFRRKFSRVASRFGEQTMRRPPSDSTGFPFALFGDEMKNRQCRVAGRRSAAEVFQRPKRATVLTGGKIEYFIPLRDRTMAENEEEMKTGAVTG